MGDVATGGTPTGATAAAAIAQAIKASGAIVRVQPRDFMSVLQKIDQPLVVIAEGGLLKTNYQYLTGYKGLVFFTKSETPLQLPSDIELITAKKIWIP
jgi:ABC-type transport system substrate-binding protein